MKCFRDHLVIKDMMIRCSGGRHVQIQHWFIFEFGAFLCLNDSHVRVQRINKHDPVEMLWYEDWTEMKWKKQPVSKEELVLLFKSTLKIHRNS